MNSKNKLNEVKNNISFHKLPSNSNSNSLHLNINY